MFDKFNYNYKNGMILINKSIKELVAVVKNKERASKQLIENINCSKIFCCETARNTMFEVQSSLGSISLLENGTNPSNYIPNIIAEGDCGILRQKLAGDSMHDLISNKFCYLLDTLCGKRSAMEFLLLCLLMLQLMIDTKLRGMPKEKSWLLNHDNVMAISQAKIMHIVKSSKL
jgi:hypothetical protein